MRNIEPTTEDVSASIVIFRNPVEEILCVIGCLVADGVTTVVLVDNAPDGSPFQAMASLFPQVQYIPSPDNVGYGAGHNKAIRLCAEKYRYHLICNPDISFSPGVVPCLVAEMNRRPNVGLCMPRIVDVAGATQPLCKRLPRPADLFGRRFLPRKWLQERMRYYEMRDCSYDEEMQPQSLSGCFMFFRSSVLSKIGGFDERFFMYMEDVDISRRAAAVASNLYYPKVNVIHGHRAGSYHNLRLFLIHISSVVTYFNKWGWRPLL